MHIGSAFGLCLIANSGTAKNCRLTRTPVKNVFLPRMEKALRREEKLAERLDKKEQLSRKI